jgi:hypothetical protein
LQPDWRELFGLRQTSPEWRVTHRPNSHRPKHVPFAGFNSEGVVLPGDHRLR